MTGIIVAPDGSIVSLTEAPEPLVGIPGVVVFGTSGATLLTPSIVPLNPVPSQRLTVTLSNQVCLIKVYGKSIYVPVTPGIPTDPPAYEQANPIFLDLYVNDVLIIGGVLCLNQNKIVRNSYLGFTGDLAFFDTQGDDDPQVSGLGSRWLLTYWADLL